MLQCLGSGGQCRALPEAAREIPDSHSAFTSPQGRRRYYRGRLASVKRVSGSFFAGVVSCVALFDWLIFLLCECGSFLFVAVPCSLSDWLLLHCELPGAFRLDNIVA